MVLTKSNILNLFLILLVTNLIAYYLVGTLETDEVLYKDYSNFFDHEAVMERLAKRQNFDRILIRYSVQSLWVISKIMGTALLLAIGLLIFNFKLSLLEILAMTIPAYFVFLLPDIMKFIWFSFFQLDYVMADLNTFTHFSLSDLIAPILNGSEDLAKFIVRLLRVMNLFNFLFCLIVSFLLVQTKRVSRLGSFKLVFIPYFTGLAILRLLELLVASTVMS